MWGGIRGGHPEARVHIQNNISWNNLGFDISNVNTVQTTINAVNICKEAHCNFTDPPGLRADATPETGSPALNNAEVPTSPFQQPNNPAVFANSDICAVPRGIGGGWYIGAIETVHNDANEPVPDLFNLCVVQQR